MIKIARIRWWVGSLDSSEKAVRLKYYMLYITIAQTGGSSPTSELQKYPKHWHAGNQFMREDKALEGPSPCKAKLFPRRFRLPFLFSWEIVQVRKKQTIANRRRIRLQQNDGIAA